MENHLIHPSSLQCDTSLRISLCVDKVLQPFHLRQIKSTTKEGASSELPWLSGSARGKQGKRAKYRGDYCTACMNMQFNNIFGGKRMWGWTRKLSNTTMNDGMDKHTPEVYRQPIIQHLLRLRMYHPTSFHFPWSWNVIC